MARINLFRLTAIHASRRYRFFLRLTAIIDFFLPHSKNQFHLPDGNSRLTAMLSRFCPERQPIRMLIGIIYNVIFGQRAGLPLSWLKTC
jgi:hypothetical protein